MADLTVSADIDAFMASANDAAARLELGLTALATTTPGAGIATFLATPTSANLAAAVTNETGTGALVFGTSPGFTTAANPVSNDGASLGTSALNWADLFLASGAVINFNNGNFGLTHNNAGAFLLVNPGDLRITSANVGTNADSVPTLSSTSTLTNKTLASPTLTGTTTATTVNATTATVTNLNPVANDGAPLGTSALSWSDLFLASGAVINFNAGDVTLTHGSNSLTLAGGELILPTDGPTSTLSAGFRGIPQNSQSAAYTTVLADAGRHILHPTADNNARTFTIDSNANVAYPIGTSITFVNQINTVTIAITSDTLVLAGAGTTGSRTLAANGIATAVKIASTTWMINGTGLT